MLNDEMTFEVDTKFVEVAELSMKLTGAKVFDSPRARVFGHVSGEMRSKLHISRIL